MINVGITGLGSCLPETSVTNEQFSEIMYTSDEWISERTGIKTRRIATAEESLPILMSVAGIRALRDAKISAGDLDYIISASNSTDQMLVPHLAARVQSLISAGENPCFDVSAGCTGVNYAVEVGMNAV